MNEHLATHIYIYRKIDSTVTDLVAHLEWKINLLPELAQRFSLSPDAIETLRQNLEAEKTCLQKLPPDANLGEIMERYFAAGKNFRQGVTDKKRISRQKILAAEFKAFDFFAGGGDVENEMEKLSHLIFLFVAYRKTRILQYLSGYSYESGMVGFANFSNSY